MKFPNEKSLPILSCGKDKEAEIDTMQSLCELFAAYAAEQKFFPITLEDRDLQELQLRCNMHVRPHKQLAELLNRLAKQAELGFEFRCDTYHRESGEYYLTVRQVQAAAA